MLHPIDIENRIKEVKPLLASEYGVDRIGYFGSFANGDYTDHSDIDIVVDFSRRVGNSLTCMNF